MFNLQTAALSVSSPALSALLVTSASCEANRRIDE
jgi:hypothetical protein